VLASWSAPAVASRLTAAAAAAAQEMAPPSETKAVEASALAQPAASAQRVLLPAAAEAEAVPCGQAGPLQVAAAESDARVPPQEEAAELDAAALRPEVAAVAELDAAAVPLPEVAAAGSDVAELPPAAEAAVPGVEAVQPPGAAAVARRVAEVQRPGAAGAPVAWGQQRAAVHPSAAPWVCRPGQALPWLAPRRAVRSAHAMRRSRAASPSKQLWQAARCEGLS
jgi:hypothetical protein